MIINQAPLMDTHKDKRTPIMGENLLKAYLTSVVTRNCNRNCNRNRNLRISRAPLKSEAHQGISLFTSAATNTKGFPKGKAFTLRLKV